MAAEAERCRQAGRLVPDVRLLSVNGRVFGAVFEEFFSAPGRSGAGLEITGTTLANALD